jgi:trafficking protein particle complex subunit 13
MLPASFGAIQLGETFSSCLCVNNEAQVEVEGVTLKVEMQTVTSKVLLAEFGGSEYRLAAGDALETVVHHEIKELGQHVLACTVSYNQVNASADDDAKVQTFRKFYKFAVSVVMPDFVCRL